MIQVRSTEPGLALPNDQDATGRSLGAEELARLADVIASGTLTSTKGDARSPSSRQRFAALLGVRARGRLLVRHRGGPRRGRRDRSRAGRRDHHDRRSPTWAHSRRSSTRARSRSSPTSTRVTGNVTAETVADCALRPHVGDRRDAPVRQPVRHDRRSRRSPTRAGIPVIEDCAQAFLAPPSGPARSARSAPSAASACSRASTSPTGEGGLVVTDDADARPPRCASSSTRPGATASADPDHDFLALNYRMTELQGAVASAQLDKLEAGVATAHRRCAERLDRDARRRRRASPRRRRAPATSHTYWRTRCSSTRAVVPVARARWRPSCKLGGIASAPRYIQKPAFRCGVFPSSARSATSRWPFTLARPEARRLPAERFPGTFAFLDSVLVLPWNERYEHDHVELLGAAIRARRRAPDREGRMTELGPRLESGSSAPAASRSPTSRSSRTSTTRGSPSVSPTRAADAAARSRTRCRGTAYPSHRALARRARTSTRSSCARRRRPMPRSRVHVDRARAPRAVREAARDRRRRARPTMVEAARGAGVIVHHGDEVPLRRRRRSGRASIVDSGHPRRAHRARERRSPRGWTWRGRWNADPAIAGGGVLIDNGTHSVDIVRYFLGPIAEVMAVGGQAGAAPRRSRTRRACCSGRPTGRARRPSTSRGASTASPTPTSRCTGPRARSSVGWNGARYRQASSPEWVTFGSGYDKVACMRRPGRELLRGPSAATRSSRSPRTTRSPRSRWSRPRTRARRAATGSRSATSPGGAAAAGEQRRRDGSAHRSCGSTPPRRSRPGVEIGDGTAVWSGVHVRGPGTRIGVDCIVGEKTLHRVRRRDRRPREAERVRLRLHRRHDRGRRDGRRGHDLHQRPLPRATTPDLATLRAVRARRAHVDRRVVGAGASHRRRLRDRLRPHDRPLRAGRHGRGRDPRGVAPFHLVVGQPARVGGRGRRRCGEPIVRFSGARPPDRDEVVCPRQRAALRDPRRRGRRARPPS